MAQGGSSSGEGGVATEGPGGVPADSHLLLGTKVTTVCLWWLSGMSSCFVLFPASVFYYLGLCLLYNFNKLKRQNQRRLTYLYFDISKRLRLK